MGYGRPTTSLEVFLDSMGSDTSTWRVGVASQPCAARICLYRGLHAYPRTTIAWVALPFCVTPSLAYWRPKPAAPRKERHRCATAVSLGRLRTGTGISTGYPSTTPFGLALGPDLPWADDPSPGTLGHPAEGFLPPLSLLMPTFSLHTAPRLGHPAALSRYRRSPTQHTRFRDLRCAAAASVHGLAPLHYRRRASRPVSYYALFQGWLLLSQPPGCLGRPTSFPT